MNFTSAPSSVLFVKVNFKRSPYANALIALRIVAHNFAEFKSNDALQLVDLEPEFATLEHVKQVVETMRIKANAVDTDVTIPRAVFRKLALRS